MLASASPEQQSKSNRPQPSHDARLPFSAGSPDARVTRAARRQEFVHRQPRPTHAGARQGGAPFPVKGEGWKCEEAGGNEDHAEKGFTEASAFGGTKAVAEAFACDGPSRGDHGGSPSDGKATLRQA